MSVNLKDFPMVAQIMIKFSKHFAVVQCDNTCNQYVHLKRFDISDPASDVNEIIVTVDRFNSKKLRIQMNRNETQVYHGKIPVNDDTITNLIFITESVFGTFEGNIEYDGFYNSNMYIPSEIKDEILKN